MLQGRLNANHLRVGLGVYKTGKAITGGASDAFALLRVSFVQENANREMKRLVAELLQVVAQLLNPRFVRDRWKAIRFTGGWFRRIFSPNSMDLIKVFRLGVIRLQIFILQWPRG